jgi:uncharacterized ferredoxin-like protein
MPIITSGDAEKNCVLEVAQFMVSAARTAPKGRGEDRIVAAIVYGEEKEKLAKEMERLASDNWLTRSMPRDARNVRDSQAVVLIGTKAPGKPKDNGEEQCIYDVDYFSRKEVSEEFRELPPCGMFLIDLGIAVGSAVKIACDLNVDNRVMLTVGIAARSIGLLKAGVVIGIPLSVSGKDPFFDRKWWYIKHHDYYAKSEK